MSRRFLPSLAGVLVAAVVGAALYVLVVDSVTLALAAGVAWGSAAGITTHLAARFPDHTTASEWTSSRWTALGVAAVTFATLLGVNAVESLPTDLRFALATVTLGVGYAGYLAGSMAELERAVE